MAVYVDEPAYPYRGMLMCHMLADTPEELHSMAVKIGIKRRWFQDKASTPHYDISKGKRDLAVKAGAKEVDRRELAGIIRQIHRTLHYKNGKPFWGGPVSAISERLG